MKKTISIIICVLMLMQLSVSLAVPAFAYTSDDGFWEYSLSSGDIKITGYNGNATGTVTVPAKIDGYNVISACFSTRAKKIVFSEGITTVDEYTFGAYNNYVEEVTLPSTVTTISDYGFYCCNALKTINLPDNLTSIGEKAFYSCENLQGVVIPDKVTSIGKYAFHGAGISYINIPSGVKTIDADVCSECQNLTTLYVSDGVTKINKNSFITCTNLSAAYLPASLVSIAYDDGSDPFSGDSNLVIYGEKNTEAQNFANTYGYKFVAVVAVKGVSVSPESATIKPGETVSLTATVTPSDASNSSVVWVSSDTSVATVSDSGVVTSIKEGVAGISAVTVDGEYVATCVVSVHNHSYTSSVTKAATCVEKGIMTYICSCGDSYTEDIAMTAHSYTSSVTKPATCASTGIKTYICAVCGKSYTETIAKTAHNYSSAVTKEASCSETGIRTYICGTCGDTYTESISKTAHSFAKSITLEAGCESTGTLHYCCTACNYSYDEVIPATGHSYTSDISKSPTCTENGTRQYVCGNCGKTYSEEIPATGHNFGAWVTVKASTASEEGTKTRTCTVCGATESQAISRLAVIYVPSGREVDYKNKVKMTASASNIPEGYHLAWYNGSNKVSDDATYTSGELKSDTTFTAKLVNSSGEILRDSNGNEISQSVTVKVNGSFIKKLVAFFKGIFGSQPTVSL